MSANEVQPSTAMAHTAEETGELQRCSDHLVRVLELAATWRGCNTSQIAESLLDALRGLIGLDFLYLHLDRAAQEFVRVGDALDYGVSAHRIPGDLAPWLHAEPEVWPHKIPVGGAELSILTLPLGITSRIGILVAGSRRSGFPRNEERLTLSVAAMHATLAIREAREPGDHASRELAENDRQLGLTLNNIPALAWSTTPDGMLDFANQRFLDLVGLTLAEISGVGFTRIFHPDDMPHLVSTWQEIMASKRGRDVEGRIRLADGDFRWFTFRQNPLLDSDGNVRKWYGVVLDIDDRKRAENALKASEAALSASGQNLRLMLDSLPVLAWSARPDGGAEFVNQRWVDYAGVPAEQILEWGFLNFYHPDDVESMVATWARDLARDDQTQLKGRIRRADGEYRWFYFSGRKMTDANGVVRWVGANVDIEDLTRAEEALRQSQTDLAHMTRMTTMGELTISIAHEINQPLMAIVTNAGTCLRWLDDEQLNIAQARQAAERIVRDGHRAGDIISSIRALAQKLPPRMERMDLQQAIEEVLELLGGELRRRGIEITTEFAPDARVVVGDRTQLQQVILNLIMNSAEAMASTERRRLEIRSEISNDEYSQVCIADTGIGFNPDTVARIFDAFFSTKPGGIGMGLSICRSIVESHSGRIWTSDNVPRGGVVCFTLSRARELDH